MPVPFREWSTYAKSMVRYGIMPAPPCDLVTEDETERLTRLGDSYQRALKDWQSNVLVA
jgi:hypothetical protein